MDTNWLADAYDKEDFVRVKGMSGTWLRLHSLGGLTLVARWIRDDIVEVLPKHETTTKEQKGEES